MFLAMKYLYILFLNVWLKHSTRGFEPRVNSEKVNVVVTQKFVEHTIQELCCLICLQFGRFATSRKDLLKGFDQFLTLYCLHTKAYLKISIPVSKCL